MWTKAIFVLLCLAMGVVALPTAAQEETPVPLPTTKETYYRGQVTEVVSEGQEDFGLYGTKPYVQTLKVEIATGPRQGEVIEISYGALTQELKLASGDRVILLSPDQSTDRLFIFDRYRLPSLVWLLLSFVVITIIFAGRRGALSLLGLAVSIIVLTFYVVPSIINGKNPLFVSFIGAVVIATVAIYLAHGFRRRTTIALGSTLITIVISLGLSVAFVSLVKLLGMGSEEAYYLQTAPIQGLNLRGLLLGGIIIGALGVLDDITTAQAAVIEELWLVNPELSRRELVQRGLSVGREHITSLVNTLVLAYTGASLPALLLFTIYERPVWVVANTELIAEELVRTLVGSISLMCAVPITTVLAAYFVTRQKSAPTIAQSPPIHSH